MSRWMWCFVLGTFSGLGNAGEIKVTQGPAAEPMLVSPIILEMDLDAATSENVGKWVANDEFDRYICDFVHIRRVATRVLPRKEHTDVSLKVYTFTELNRDKAIRVEITLLHDGSKLAETAIPHIEAEEGKRGYGTARMSVRNQDWPADKVPALHMVVHVRND